MLARVAEFFAPATRREDLSLSHHLEAMRGAPESAKDWLEVAAARGWSSEQLRLAILGQGDPTKYSWLRCGTFWYFSGCDPRFGVEYPGRIPGQIAANAIHYFTEPGDLVVDPMAGGGSTLDAARYLGRRCLGYDLAPARPDIGHNDALAGLPREAGGARLVFIDPPYGSIARGKYGKHPQCLSNLDERSFLDALVRVSGHCQNALTQGGHLVVVIQSVSNWTGNTVFRVEERMSAHGWQLKRRIQIPISHQHISSNVMRWARDNRQMVNTDRDLLVFRKPPCG